MTRLKSLIALRPNASPVRGESSNQGENSVQQSTISDGAYQDSKSAHGNHLVLRQCLENLYQGFKERCRKDEYYQRGIKEPFLKEQDQLKTELLKRRTAKEIKEEELINIRSKIEKINSDISNVKINPNDYGIDADKKPKAQFYIGLLVLLPITLYLIVFYISASYSAFFKDFETSNLSAAIFDAQAFSKAFDEGVLEAIFICTIPFAFMGLGYLVHMFQKEGKIGYLKIFGLYLVTFVFDAILAYLIENKIYVFEKTLTSPDFDLSIAFQKVEFWGIIFAGFVVYIIWGLVFDFVMKEHENIDKVNSYIKSLKEEKQNYINAEKELEVRVNLIKTEMSEINGKIAELQRKLESFLFSNREYLLYHSSYLRGWLLAVSRELHMPREEFDIVVNKCNETSASHLASHGVSNSDDQSTTFHIAV